MSRPPRKPRSIRVEDSLWSAALEKAARRGDVLSEVIRAALARYVSGREQQAPTQQPRHSEGTDR